MSFLTELKKFLKAAGGAFTTDAFTTVTGTTYVVSATDNGKVIRFTSATAVTITLPTGLGAGFNAVWRQVGAGQLTFVAGSGATMRSPNGLTKSGQQYAEGAIAVDQSNDWYVSGVTA